MQKVLKIFQIFLYVLLAANLFFWGTIYGSGHKVPADTNRHFAFISLVIIMLLIIVFFLRKKTL